MYIPTFFTVPRGTVIAIFTLTHQWNDRQQDTTLQETIFPADKVLVDQGITLLKHAPLTRQLMPC